MSLPADLIRLITALAEVAGESPEWMRNRLRGMPLNELTALVAKLPPKNQGRAHQPAEPGRASRAGQVDTVARPIDARIREPG
jgi:hypothetical protein